MRFREAVAVELARRRRRNGRYSLRQFARGLGVHHSTVSRLLRGSRPIPSGTLLTVATRLGMSRSEVHQFLAREGSATIIEATRRSGFRPDSRWLASVTGMRVDDVNIVLQRLLRTGALRMSSPDQWQVTEGEWNE
jgi:transcriptional regulator with XRE-family HTH domain